MLIGAFIIYVRDWSAVIGMHGRESGDYALTPDYEREVKLEANSFEIEERNEDTWFLTVGVRASLLGWVIPPVIEIRCGSEVLHQYVGPGRDGRVFVNLSGLEGTAEQKGTVRLICKRGRLDDRGTVLGFEDVSLTERTVSVIAPHPDDAEIAAFGLYSQESVNASIVNVTAGDRGQYPFGDPVQDERGIVRDSLKGDVRTWDSVTIPNLGGVPFDRCYNLGYLDGTLQMPAQDSETLGRETSVPSGRQRYRRTHSTRKQGATFGRQSLVEDLVETLEREQPDYVVCPHPRLDCYDEHRRTTDAVVQSIRELEEPPTHFFFYVVHNEVSNLFPCGPPHGRVTLPPLNGGTPLFARRPLSYTLSESQVVMKQYALEAMHELRRLNFPRRDGTTTMVDAAHTIFRGIKLALGVPSMTTSRPQMRARAARPNEVFFVEPVQDVVEAYDKYDE